MSFVKHKKWYYIFSGILMVIAIGVILLWGLRLGIDFTGGTLWEIKTSQGVEEEALRKVFEANSMPDALIQKGDDNNFLIRIQTLDEKQHQKISMELKNSIGEFNELRFDSVGPLIGKELQTKAIQASLIAVVGIFIYVLIAFRKVQRVTSVWKMSLAAIVALLHDIIITVGVFAILGHFLNVEIGLPFIAAILTIFGYSVNDTVVVFDRIRENALKATALRQSLDDLIDVSLAQTLSRSMITSVLVMLSLLVIFIWGGESLRYFSLTLLIGIGFGTYSSIFVASMLLSTFQKHKNA